MNKAVDSYCKYLLVHVSRCRLQIVFEVLVLRPLICVLVVATQVNSIMYLLVLL